MNEPLQAPLPLPVIPSSAIQGSVFPSAAVDYVDAEFSEPALRPLREYLQILVKYRWLAIACFAAVFGAAIVQTLLATRLYTASAKILLSKEAPIQLRLKDDVLNLDGQGGAAPSAANLGTQMAVLRSRNLAERVIRKQHLAENDAFLRPNSDRRGVLEVGSELLGSVRPRGLPTKKLSVRKGDYTTAAEVDPGLIDRYLGYLTVAGVTGTDLIEVSFVTPNPSLSALLAAAHVQTYLESAEEMKVEMDVEARGFLDRQIRQARENLERAEATLVAFSTSHPKVAMNEEYKEVANRVSKYSEELSKAEAERIELQSRYEFLTRKGTDPAQLLVGGSEGGEAGGTGGASAASPGASAVGRLHEALVDLAIQKSTLAGRLGPNHPQMLELTRRENETKRGVALEIEHQVISLRSRLAAAKGQEESIRKALVQVEESATDLRRLGAQYALFKADADNARAMHDSFLKQQTDTAVRSQLDSSNARVIERPELPRAPSKPDKQRNLLLGGLAGLAAAVAAILAADRLDNSVKTSKEIESLLQIPPLATIPNFALARKASARRKVPGSGRKAELPAAGGVQPMPVAVEGSTGGGGPGPLLVVHHEPRSVISEAFRSLRTNILFSRAGAPPKLIMVASAGMSEGKTVISCNLATTLAESGARVILIDSDMRHPSCHPHFGVSNQKGLSSFLTGVAIEEVIQELDAPRLSFISAGPHPPNPAELIGSTRMREALEKLRAEYDFVVVDSPALIPVTDGVVLSRLMDGCVLVVKGQDTPREMVLRARDLLRFANAHILGGVMNNVDLGWGSSYYYGGYYGYYYYGGYDQQEDEEVEETRGAA